MVAHGSSCSPANNTTEYSSTTTITTSYTTTDKSITTSVVLVVVVSPVRSSGVKQEAGGQCVNIDSKCMLKYRPGYGKKNFERIKPKSRISSAKTTFVPENNTTEYSSPRSCTCDAWAAPFYLIQQI